MFTLEMEVTFVLRILVKAARHNLRTFVGIVQDFSSKLFDHSHCSHHPMPEDYMLPADIPQVVAASVP
jgi:hypothetical protein